MSSSKEQWATLGGVQAERQLGSLDCLEFYRKKRVLAEGDLMKALIRSGEEAGGGPKEGDLVIFHNTTYTEEGAVVESTRAEHGGSFWNCRVISFFHLKRMSLRNSFKLRDTCVTWHWASGDLTSAKFGNACSQEMEILTNWCWGRVRWLPLGMSFFRPWPREKLLG